MEEIPDIEDMAMDDLDEIPQRVLLQFIQELPPGYRTVFNLYVMEEKSHKEIAQLLGITEHSSSSQLSRARALLVKKVNHYKKVRE
jgi:RNA polymerase sigma-70 factor (ECF subfamily)